jgi:hypothetical protein
MDQKNGSEKCKSLGEEFPIALAKLLLPLFEKTQIARANPRILGIDHS